MATSTPDGQRDGNGQGEPVPLTWNFTYQGTAPPGFHEGIEAAVTACVEGFYKICQALWEEATWEEDFDRGHGPRPLSP
jgi:hypothetical protein